MPNLVARGFLFGRSELVNFEYDASKPYTYCRICGRLRQTAADRLVPAKIATPSDERSTIEATLDRKRWSLKHSESHSKREHLELALSGLHLTPEAASKLAPFGIIDLVGLALYEEHADAYLEAPRVPDNDADGC